MGLRKRSASFYRRLGFDKRDSSDLARIHNKIVGTFTGKIKRRKR